MALAAYRHLLRSAKIAFQGDTRVLTSALSTARSDFKSARSLSPGSTEAEAKVAHAEEVARILRNNVVQGSQGQGDKYLLRIHEHTERGDNNSIKLAGKSLMNETPSGECCGGSASATPGTALR